MDPQADEQLRSTLVALREQMAKVIVGQDGVVTGLLTAALANGHVLLEGVPGVAKTLAVKTFSAALSLDFARIQFTPDLLPADVTGQLVLDPSTRRFEHRAGPVFTNVLLADELNRTPPKTQAALLEAMEERQVTIDGEARPLPDPFLVVATQNPIEYEGTYSLPEAQLDRFLLKLVVGYPAAEHEQAMLRRHDEGLDPHDLSAAGVRSVASAADLAAARRAVHGVRTDDRVLGYLVELVKATRDHPAVALGVSPRGAAALLHAAKAWAWLSGKGFVGPDEVKAVAKPAMRHRLLLESDAVLDGSDADAVLDRVLASVPVPR